MGSDHTLRGTVESVAAGIEDRDRSAGTTLLANVNPTFNWVRLAQRVPVRIALDRAVRNELVAGASATVEVLGFAHESRTSVGACSGCLTEQWKTMARIDGGYHE
jgi:multidrug resistance efflux pump